MRKCCNCGKLRGDGDNYCTECGSNYFVTVEREAEELSPAPEEMPPRKPHPVGSFFKALAYPLIYILIQYAVTFIYCLAYGFFAAMLGRPVDMESLMSGGTLEVISLLSNIILIITFICISAAKRRNPLQNYGVNGFNPRLVLPCALLGAAVNVIMSVIISLVPWQDSWVESLESTYSDVGSGGMLLSLLSVCLITGVAEELLFRGAMLSQLRRSFGSTASVIITALIFGLIHGSPIAIIYSTLLGLILGAMTVKTGSAAPAMISHMFFNAASLLLEYVNSELLIIALMLLSVASAILCMWLVFRNQANAEFDS